METYSFLRQLADSWGLLTLFLLFAGVIFWAFRPGSSPLHADAASVPFRHEDRPVIDRPAPALRTKAADPGGCGSDSCTCGDHTSVPEDRS